MPKAILNPTMPQAQWFFVYILWKDDGDQETSLQPNVVMGFDQQSLGETRRLVQAGVEIQQLLYLGPVCALESHHRRAIKNLLREVPPEPGPDNNSTPPEDSQTENFQI